VVETNNQGERVGSGDEMHGTFWLSTDAPQAGDLDRLLRTGSLTQEQTSQPVEEVQPIHVVNFGRGSPADFLNSEEDIGEMGAQLGREVRPEGGRGGNSDSQPSGVQGGKPNMEQQTERREDGSQPAVLNEVENPENQEGQQVEERRAEESLPWTTGGPGLVVRI
jgi:hypothetical protein